MINIISTCATHPKVNGPTKCYLNLVKGLAQLGYPFVTNRSFDATQRLWVHDNPDVIRFFGQSRAFKIVGPSVYFLPEQIPPSVYPRLRDTIFLMPSAWAKQRWEWVLHSVCPVQVWPVGIDTDTFRPAITRPVSTRAIIYHKQRKEPELINITACLEQRHIPYTLIRYSQYNETDYLEALQATAFVIWHGCSETQGLALQEALACNVPMLVCDIEPRPDLPVTAAPYFNDTCGIKINNLAHLGLALDNLLDNLGQFTPRDYILRHLSLAGQARAFVNLWQHWNLTFEEGMAETPRSNHPWQAPWYYRLGKQWEQRLPRGLAARLKRAVLRLGL